MFVHCTALTTSSTSPESPVWRNQGAAFVLSATTVGGPTSPLASLLVTTICSWPIKFREMRWLIGDAPQWSWCAARSLGDSYALQDHCVILMRCRILVWFLRATGSLCDSYALQDHCVILMRCRIIVWFLCAAGLLCDSCALQDYWVILVRCRIIVWFLCAAGSLFDSYALQDHCMILVRCRIIVWFWWAAGSLCDSDALPDHCLILMRCRTMCDNVENLSVEMETYPWSKQRN